MQRTRKVESIEPVGPPPARGRARHRLRRPRRRAHLLPRRRTVATGCGRCDAGPGGLLPLLLLARRRHTADRGAISGGPRVPAPRQRSTPSTTLRRRPPHPHSRSPANARTSPPSPDFGSAANPPTKSGSEIGRYRARKNASNMTPRREESSSRQVASGPVGPALGENLGGGGSRIGPRIKQGSARDAQRRTADGEIRRTQRSRCGAGLGRKFAASLRLDACDARKYRETRDLRLTFRAPLPSRWTLDDHGAPHRVYPRPGA